ncbi:unnamed protein product [Rotaria sordida]|uniref:Endonuclease/exonuclease/phosphatase domain-containing protein n=1 Tax=Rotaria sordida TaxID=392033 RepID=A0A819UKH4_9BILA|nr:unnamed protein product [Rotaria sordida]
MIDEWNTKIETIPERTLIGAVYVPPGKSPPLHLFSKYRNKPFFIFGDFNAKHSSWDCEINNNSGNQIASWLEQTGNSMILPNKSTSRRSNSIIDFGLTHDASGWITEVLDEDVPIGVFFLIFYFWFISIGYHCLWDRSSIYKSAKTYRPPWPPSLVFLAQQKDQKF